jgi:hypothetical protein
MVKTIYNCGKNSNIKRIEKKNTKRTRIIEQENQKRHAPERQPRSLPP